MLPRRAEDERVFESLGELARLALEPLCVEDVYARGFAIVERALGARSVRAIDARGGQAAPHPQEGCLDVDFPDRDAGEPRLLRIEFGGAVPEGARALAPVAAMQLAAAVRAARLAGAHVTLRGEAETDALTGIANRRTFDTALNDEWNRAVRARETIALAMIDVDYFKSYNDRYGHARGDRALRDVAQAIASAARRGGETCARYGGEEFALILPGISLDAAIDRCETIRTAVAEARIEHAGSQLFAVSISIGVAAVSPGPDDRVEELLKLADAALYNAKRCGRNRVVGEGYESQAPPALQRFEAQHNLPNYATRMFGRDRDIAALTELLAAHRIVSVVGIGGVGKTRLAVAAAAEHATFVKDGAWFVDLSGLFDPQRIFDRIVSALGLPRDPKVSAEQTAVTALRERELTIVLDNCEHLLDGVAEAVQTLVRETPKTRIVVTSRIPLEVPGEKVMRLAALAASDAAELFLDRGAEHDAISKSSVEDLCLQLDGLPMAIELAAARLSTLSLDELRAALSDRFGVLTSRPGRAPSRQQTLEALFAWSCDLLEPRERDTLVELSVFAGSFTETAGARVVMAPLPRAMMEELVRKSLLLREESGRLRLPNSLAEFAHRELSDERRRVMEVRHIRYYRDVAARANERYTKVPVREWLASLVLDLDNFFVALARGLEGSREAVLAGADLAASMRRYFELAGRIDEGIEWTARYLAALPEDVSALLRGRLLSERTRLLEIRSKFSESLATAVDAVRLLREAGEPRLLAYALSQLGNAQLFTNDVDAAEASLRESVAISERLEQSALARASALSHLVNISMYYRTDYALAERYLQECLTAFAELGHEANEAWTYGQLAELRFRTGKLDEALDCAQRAVTGYRGIGDHPNLGAELERYARVLLELGRLDDAIPPLEEAFQRFVRHNHAEGTIEAIVDFSLLAAKRRKWDTAAALLGYARTRESSESLPSQADHRRVERIIEESIDAARLTAALQRGTQADVHDLIAEALA